MIKRLEELVRDHESDMNPLLEWRIVRVRAALAGDPDAMAAEEEEYDTLLEEIRSDYLSERWAHECHEPWNEYKEQT